MLAFSSSLSIFSNAGMPLPPVFRLSRHVLKRGVLAAGQFAILDSRQTGSDLLVGAVFEMAHQAALLERFLALLCNRPCRGCLPPPRQQSKPLRRMAQHVSETFKSPYVQT